MTWPLYWHYSLIARDMLQDGLQPVKCSEVISLGRAPDGYRLRRKIHFSLLIKAFFSPSAYKWQSFLLKPLHSLYSFLLISHSHSESACSLAVNDITACWAKAWVRLRGPVIVLITAHSLGCFHCRR